MRRRVVVVWLAALERTCVVVVAALCPATDAEEEKEALATPGLLPAAVADWPKSVEGEGAAASAVGVATGSRTKPCQKPPNTTAVAASTAHRAGALFRRGFWRGARREVAGATAGAAVLAGLPAG